MRQFSVCEWIIPISALMHVEFVILCGGITLHLTSRKAQVGIWKLVMSIGISLCARGSGVVARKLVTGLK